MFFRKNKNNQRQVEHNLEHDKLAQTWVNRCIKLQHNASSFLQAKSEKLSLKAKRLVAIGFCLISFSSCVYQIVKSFYGNDKVNLSIAAIRVPEQVTQNENREIAPSNEVSKNEFKKIKKFRAYIDSLARSNSGRRIYDSIHKYRPGLIDSLAIIENIYKSQSPNK
jgi:hypothetical protein